ncbi:hypothetical protein F8388_006863 [Cannabis sativa]|uniref:Telomerase Cajal body protein 1 n=1 Tax=Cannabis sativa TaxID=3483 RepID=A0A7J6GVV6_CANSA|nr:hypothetical protein F8388_006863 [Cannabis sativa]
MVEEDCESEQPSLPNITDDPTNLEEPYQWPVIRFDVPPYRTHHFFHQFRTGPNPNNFLKSVKWSPDGSCFLTNSEDNTFRTFMLPENGNDYLDDSSVNDGGDSYAANLVVNEGESVYDFCWYPYMSASDPVTNVFASTSRDHPIHLWDASSGELRCTYRAYDAMDEITAAFSIAFNPFGTKIFAGYNKSVRVFDLHRPGREFKQFSTLQGNKEGQTGILSAMAFCPTHSGMLAIGSYSQTTGIYREDNMELLYVLHGQEGGITHIQFSKDGNYLYTGGRKDPYILCWDMRKAVDVVYKTKIIQFAKPSIHFFEAAHGVIDCYIDHQNTPTSGYHLISNHKASILVQVDGTVHIYDLKTGQWVSSFQAALDTVSGFSFHPFLPMAASSSGHRRFVVPGDGSEDDDLHLGAEENCASVWSFSFESAVESDVNVYKDGLKSGSEHENLNQNT